MPKVSLSATVREAVLEMSKKGLGMTAIENIDGTAWGVFTDGDLRCAFERDIPRDAPIADVATCGCISLHKDILAVKSAEVMQKNKIHGMLVTDDYGKLVGAFDLNDLMQAGVV